jgi:hypothetical protein
MTHSLHKWTRQIHRWFAYPFVVLIVLLLFMRQTEAGSVLLRVQQAMVLVMALTGCYMLALPYLARRKRAARR